MAEEIHKEQMSNLMLKNPTQRKLDTDEIATLILLAALLFGALFRFFPAWLAGFPVNDGGMFYVMMKDLQANHFIPPAFTTYNKLNIPFAYPPLALYIGAGIGSLFNISLIEILRWLPALINTLCVPVFYFLSKEFLEDKFKASIATLVFAFIPHLNTWLSSGGGLTRSFGTLFMMVTVIYSYRFFSKNISNAIWGVIIFGSLTVLSHTESTIFAIALPVYIWMAKSRSMKTALQGGSIALGVIAVAGPWYGLVIYRHGMAPLLSALTTGGQTFWSVLRLINIDIITEEPYLDLIGVIGVLGMITLLAKKQYFIPLMLVLIYLVQPRSAHTVGNIPLAMAGAIFLVDILFPALAKISGAQNPNSNRGIKVFLIISIPYLLVNSIYQGFTLSQNHVSKDEQTAMAWVKENTPEDSQFLVLTGESESMCESTAEWFPAFAERQSLSTLQGREWILGRQFGEFIGHRINLQNCIDENLTCLNREAKYFGTDYNYIYLSVKTPTSNCKAAELSTRTTRGLVIALENSMDYSTAYQAEDAVIFEKIK
jgi:hypothetical protein